MSLKFTMVPKNPQSGSANLVCRFAHFLDSAIRYHKKNLLFRHYCPSLEWLDHLRKYPLLEIPCLNIGCPFNCLFNPGASVQLFVCLSINPFVVNLCHIKHNKILQICVAFYLKMSNFGRLSFILVKTYR